LPDDNLLNTPGKLLNWAERRFIQSDLCYGHGTDNPLDEAAYLILGGLSIPFNADAEILEQTLSYPEVQKIKELVQKRIETRRPVAYLLNQAWFAGLSFYVDERVLIPRSPLAELILEAFSPWLKSSNVKRILDIGTGSGCIAITCATVFPNAVVDATDIDAEALAVARLNAEKHKVSERINLIRSDLFHSLGKEKYDIIISNPPYVPDDEMPTLSPEYQHEPAQALRAGADGLDIAERILSRSHAYLSADGILVVEVGNARAPLETKYPTVPFVWLEFEHGGEGVFLLLAGDLAILKR